MSNDLWARLSWAAGQSIPDVELWRDLLVQSADEVVRLQGGASKEFLAEALYEGGLAPVLLADPASRKRWPQLPPRLRADYRRYAGHVLRRLLPGGEPPT